MFLDVVTQIIPPYPYTIRTARKRTIKSLSGNQAGKVPSTGRRYNVRSFKVVTQSLNIVLRIDRRIDETANTRTRSIAVPHLLPDPKPSVIPGNFSH